MSHQKVWAHCEPDIYELHTAPVISDDLSTYTGESFTDYEELERYCYNNNLQLMGVINQPE